MRKKRERDKEHELLNTEPNYYDYFGRRRRFVWKRLIRIGVALVLFLAIFGLSRFDYPHEEAVRERLTYYLTDNSSDRLNVLVTAFQTGIWSDTIEKGVVETLGKLDLNREASLESLAIPVSGQIVRVYGWEEQPDGQKLLHPGVDIRALEASGSVVSALGGNVRYIGKNSRLGNYVELDHGNGIVTVYGNCQEILVMEGQQVQKGLEIARLKAEPQAYVHFELRNNGRPIDPLSHFTGAEVEIPQS